MLFSAAIGDSVLARRRLKGYYAHAAKGTGQAYLVQCHLASSWDHWAITCQAARDGGVLRVLKGRFRRRRRSARVYLRHWRGLAVLQQLEVTVLLQSLRRALARSFHRFSVQQRLASAFTSIDLKARCIRCHFAFQQWHSYMAALDSAPEPRAMPRMRRSPMRMRRAIEAWLLHISVLFSVNKSMSSAAAIDMAGRMRASLFALRSYAGVRRRVVVPFTLRHVAHGWRRWRVYYRGVRLALAIRSFEAICPPEDPVLEARRFVTSWRHRQKLAWRVWATQPVLGWWVQRFAIARWRTRHSSAQHVNNLAMTRRVLGDLGRVYTRWRQNASHQRDVAIDNYQSSGFHIVMTLRYALDRLRARSRVAHSASLGARWAKQQAWLAWRAATQHSSQRGVYETFTRSIGARLALHFALSAWRKGFARTEMRDAHIATCEELKEVYLCGRALVRWQCHRAQLAKGPQSRQKTAEIARFMRVSLCGRAVRAWAMNRLGQRGVAALSEMALQLRIRTAMKTWSRVYRMRPAWHAPSEIQLAANRMRNARVVRRWAHHSSVDGGRRALFDAGAATIFRMRRRRGLRQLVRRTDFTGRVRRHLYAVHLRLASLALDRWAQSMPLLVAESASQMMERALSSSDERSLRTVPSWSTPQSRREEVLRMRSRGVAVVMTPPTVSITHRHNGNASRLEQHSGRFYAPFAVFANRRIAIAADALSYWCRVSKWRTMVRLRVVLRTSLRQWRRRADARASGREETEALLALGGVARVRWVAGRNLATWHSRAQTHALHATGRVVASAFNARHCLSRAMKALRDSCSSCFMQRQALHRGLVLRMAQSVHTWQELAEESIRLVVLADAACIAMNKWRLGQRWQTWQGAVLRESRNAVQFGTATEAWVTTHLRAATRKWTARLADASAEVLLALALAASVRLALKSALARLRLDTARSSILRGNPVQVASRLCKRCIRAWRVWRADKAAATAIARTAYAWLCTSRLFRRWHLQWAADAHLTHAAQRALASAAGWTQRRLVNVWSAWRGRQRRASNTELECAAAGVVAVRLLTRWHIWREYASRPWRSSADLKLLVTAYISTRLATIRVDLWLAWRRLAAWRRTTAMATHRWMDKALHTALSRWCMHVANCRHDESLAARATFAWCRNSLLIGRRRWTAWTLRHRQLRPRSLRLVKSARCVAEWHSWAHDLARLEAVLSSAGHERRRYHGRWRSWCAWTTMMRVAAAQMAMASHWRRNGMARGALVDWRAAASMSARINYLAARAVVRRRRLALLTWHEWARGPAKPWRQQHFIRLLRQHAGMRHWQRGLLHRVAALQHRASADRVFQRRSAQATMLEWHSWAQRASALQGAVALAARRSVARGLVAWQVSTLHASATRTRRTRATSASCHPDFVNCHRALRQWSRVNRLHLPAALWAPHRGYLPHSVALRRMVAHALVRRAIDAWIRSFQRARAVVAHAPPRPLRGPFMMLCANARRAGIIAAQSQQAMMHSLRVRLKLCLSALQAHAALRLALALISMHERGVPTSLVNSWRGWQVAHSENIYGVQVARLGARVALALQAAHCTRTLVALRSHARVRRIGAVALAAAGVHAARQAARYALRQWAALAGHAGEAREVELSAEVLNWRLLSATHWTQGQTIETVRMRLRVVCERWLLLEAGVRGAFERWRAAPAPP